MSIKENNNIVKQENDKDPVWLAKFYTPSSQMPQQYRSPAFEKNLKTIQFNYAGSILAVYEDIGKLADQVRGVIDAIINRPMPDEDKINSYKELKEKLFKRRDQDGEGWWDNCPKVWYASPLATLVDPNMTHIDLGVGTLGNATMFKMDWDIII